MKEWISEREKSERVRGRQNALEEREGNEKMYQIEKEI